MNEIRNEKGIMLTIVVSFLAAFIINTLSGIIYPPDLGGEFPIYDADWAMVVQVAGAFLLIALTVIAMKAEEEKQILAAAGFTAIAISSGISIISLFDIINITTFQQYENYYRVSLSSNFLLIPAVVLIATYSHFKMWIRFVSILSVLPLLVGSVMFLFGIRNFILLEYFINTGIILNSLCWVLWAFNIYTNYRDELKN
jgi:hypothetical protein